MSPCPLQSARLKGYRVRLCSCSLLGSAALVRPEDRVLGGGEPDGTLQMHRPLLLAQNPASPWGRKAHSVRAGSPGGAGRTGSINI